MLAVVAEKTGYPADMLNLGMDLEGDLGIDSIKRVEILSAVQEQAPGLPKVDMAHMAALRTLGAIVDYMRGLAGEARRHSLKRRFPRVPRRTRARARRPPQTRSRARRPARPAPGAVPLGRYVLERIEAPAAGLAQPGLLGGGEVWVTGGGALDEALAAELERRGVERAVDGRRPGRRDRGRLPRRPARRSPASTRRSPSTARRSGWRAALRPRSRADGVSS